MNAVQCDYCGKFASNPEGRDWRGHHALPDPWWSVAAQLGGADEGAKLTGDGGEFCSRECVSAHFAKPFGTVIRDARLVG